MLAEQAVMLRSTGQPRGTSPDLFTRLRVPGIVGQRSTRYGGSDR